MSLALAMLAASSVVVYRAVDDGLTSRFADRVEHHLGGMADCSQTCATAMIGPVTPLPGRRFRYRIEVAQGAGPGAAARRKHAFEGECAQAAIAPCAARAAAQITAWQEAPDAH